MLLHIARSGYPMAEHAILGCVEPACPEEGFRPVADSFDVLRALLNCDPVEQRRSAPSKHSAGGRGETTRQPGSSRAKQAR